MCGSEQTGFFSHSRIKRHNQLNFGLVINGLQGSWLNYCLIVIEIPGLNL